MTLNKQSLAARDAGNKERKEPQFGIAEQLEKDRLGCGHGTWAAVETFLPWGRKLVNILAFLWLRSVVRVEMVRPRSHEQLVKCPDPRSSLGVGHSQLRRLGCEVETASQQVCDENSAISASRQVGDWWRRLSPHDSVFEGCRSASNSS
jgi:hypothetical protein